MRGVVRIVGKSGGGHVASVQTERTAAAGYTTMHVDTEAEGLVALQVRQRSRRLGDDEHLGTM
jgi:hypothetical protein